MAWAYRTSLAVQTSSEGSLTQSTTRTVSAQSPFHAKAAAITAANPNTDDFFMKKILPHTSPPVNCTVKGESAHLLRSSGECGIIFLHIG
jgi:hypothetical protein